MWPFCFACLQRIIVVFFFACLFYFVWMSGNTSVWTLDMHDKKSCCWLWTSCGQAEQKSIGGTHYFFLTLGGQSLIGKSHLIHTCLQKLSILFTKKDWSAAAMVGWDVHTEHTIWTCYYLSAKFIQWCSAMRCVCIAKMGLGVGRRAGLPVTLYNICHARQLSLALLIRLYKKNVNKKYKSPQGSPAAPHTTSLK